MKVEYKTVINRVPGEVFAYVSCYKNDPIWLGTILESEQTSEGPPGVGTRLRRVGRILGRPIPTTAEIIEFVPDLKSCFKSLSGPLPLVETRCCEPVRGGTCFTYSISIDGYSGRLFRLSESSLAHFIQHQLEADLNNLKELLETCFEAKNRS